MNLQRHYEDERLIELLDSERDLGRDAHLNACSSCSEALESFRAITGVLREKSAWKAEPEGRADSTLAALRTFAASLRNGEAAATALVTEITALPRQWWAMKVAAETRFQTVALARSLTEKSEAAIDSMPPDAVELARAATIAADGTEDRLTIGSAYRQLAYALFYTGDINNSVNAIDKAAHALASTPSSEYELARLEIVRSLVLSAQEHYDRAIEAATRAEIAFRTFGDRKREASAILGRVFVLLTQMRYREALPVLESLEQKYRGCVDEDARGRIWGNIALCQWQMGRIVDSLRSYELSAALLEANGTPTEAARIQLNISGILAREGRHTEAKDRLRRVRAEFECRGMHYEVVFAGLILAEILLAEGAPEEVELLCRSAIQEYGTSGLAYQSQVLTALAYLHEASVQKRATIATVQHVKTYIERLPYEPNLLFAPPPLAPE